MSVDISHPDIANVKSAIESKTDPTTWFLLSYDNFPTSLKVSSSGSQPTLPSIRAKLAETDEDVIFGYAEIRGKGLVIAFLKDSVGGVRRARAVVHSRAVSTLFPDYAALITVAHHSQLSDQTVFDKLGFYNAPPSVSTFPAHENQTNQNTIDRFPHPPHPVDIGSYATSSPTKPSPPVPEKDSFVQPPTSTSYPLNGGRTVLNQSSSSIASRGSQRSQKSHHSNVIAQVERSVTPDHSQTLHSATNTTPRQTRSGSISTPLGMSKMTTPSGQPSPLPLAPPIASTPQRQTPRIVSAPVGHDSNAKGISSADMFDKDPRQRKTSLTSRLGQLGHAFSRHSPKSSSSPNTPSNPRFEQLTSPSPSSPKGSHSPHSPGMSRFMNSSLVKNFGRRSSGGPASAPSSPVSAEAKRRQSQPPPLPPKDEEIIINEVTPPRLFASPSDHPSTTTSTVPSNGHLTPVNGDTNHETKVGELGRSASAQKALYDASQKRVKDESEIQDRFRRDEEERQRQRSGERRLSEDHEDWGPRKTLMGDVLLGAPISVEPVPPIPPQYRQKEINVDKRYLSDEEEELGLPYDRPDPESPQKQSLSGTQSVSENINNSMPEQLTPNHRLEPHEGLGDVIGADESVTAQIAELDLAEEGQAGGTEIEMSIAAEEYAHRLHLERVKQVEMEEAEKVRVEQERFAEEARIKEEWLREEQKRREEEERRVLEEKRIEEERRMEQARIAELTRIEEERIAVLDRIEQDRLAEIARIEEEKRREEEQRIEEEKRKAEEERLAEERRIEEQRKKEEEERQRVEEERRRKEQTLNDLRHSKHEGRQMVSGWITVQTTKSVLWRRRYFSLYPSEMKLFKAETDEQPIQVVPLSREMKIDVVFEESQVQGSFKLTDPSGDVCFMFTDRPEDREIVLAALNIIKE